jgi:hypothetical protein
MFGIWWLIWALWKQIKGPLSQVLGDRGSALLMDFKATIATALDNLADSVIERVDEDGLWKLWADEKVMPADEDDDSPTLNLKTFPLDRLRKTPTITTALAAKLKENWQLGAARQRAKITDLEWDRILQAYSQSLVSLGMPYALERMIAQKKALFGDLVLLVQKNQAYKVNGRDNFFDMVKLLSSSDSLSVGKARRIWNARTSAKYKHEPEEYKDPGYAP